jgi:hypothetical protein
MAFIDRLKEAYKTANNEVTRLTRIWEENNTEANYDTWQAMEEEKEFINNQLKANGFDLTAEAEKLADPIQAFKCKSCGIVFEFSAECSRHIVERHVFKLF